MIRRVGILTGGGDVPGLNAVIKTLVERMEDAGREVVGLRRGWASLLHLGEGCPDASRWCLPLDRAITRRIDRTGGTMLHSSRLHPAYLKPHQVPEHLRQAAPEPGADGTLDMTDRVIAAVDALGLDAIVAIGGDGTLSFAHRLFQEGIPVVAVPKTMDNDVHGTDYSIGFSTAITRSVHLISDMRTTAGSHERVLVVELFGRYSGEPCLLSSYLASTDRALIPEVPYVTQQVVELLRADKRANPSSYAILTVAEAAYPEGGLPLESGEADAVGHKKLGGIGLVLVDDLRRAGISTMYQPLGYLMRSGPPDALDLLVAKNFGSLSADLLLADQAGLMVAIVGGRYTAVSVERVGEGKRRVDVERFYDRRAYRPRINDIKSLPMFLH